MMDIDKIIDGCATAQAELDAAWEANLQTFTGCAMSLCAEIEAMGDEMMNSQHALAPDVKSLADAPPVLSDERGLYAIPVAGKSVAF